MVVGRDGRGGDGESRGEPDGEAARLDVAGPRVASSNPGPGGERGRAAAAGRGGGVVEMIERAGGEEAVAREGRERSRGA